MRETRRRHGAAGKLVLLALRRKGPLRCGDLENLVSVMTTQFELMGVEFGARIASGVFSKMARPAVIRSRRRDFEDRATLDVEGACQDLVGAGLIEPDQSQRYQLTAKGVGAVDQFADQLERSLGVLETRFFGATAAARNTMLVYLFLTVLKLVSGVVGGVLGWFRMAWTR